MEPKEKTNDKENLQINQQPKKTWQEPVLTNLDINGGVAINYPEMYTGTISNPS